MTGELAGSLLTFSLEHHLEAAPTYRHASPWVFRRCLPCWICCSKSATSGGDRHRSGQGADRRSGGAGYDARLRGGRFLSVGALFTPPHQLQSRFPQLCKAEASHDDVAEGRQYCPQRHRDQTAEPSCRRPFRRLENQYFALDLSADAAARCWRPATAPSIPGIAWRRET